MERGESYDRGKGITHLIEKISSLRLLSRTLDLTALFVVQIAFRTP